MVMWKIVRKAIDPFRNGVIVNRKGIVPENGGIAGALLCLSMTWNSVATNHLKFAELDPSG
jgi:hypothetical protein